MPPACQTWTRDENHIGLTPKLSRLILPVFLWMGSRQIWEIKWIDTRQDKMFDGLIQGFLLHETTLTERLLSVLWWYEYDQIHMLLFLKYEDSLNIWHGYKLYGGLSPLLHVS
jgi:hypothetical protein